MCEAINYEKSFSKWRYSVISENCYRDDIGKYQTYGIQVDGPNYTDTLHDVFTRKEIVDWMAELFCRHQLSPCHLREVVENLLP